MKRLWCRGGRRRSSEGCGHREWDTAEDDGLSGTDDGISAEDDELPGTASSAGSDPSSEVAVRRSIAVAAAAVRGLSSGASSGALWSLPV